MSPLIVIRVTGHPVPAARTRSFMQKGRMIVTTPPKYRSWKNDARMVAREAMGGRAPLGTCLDMELRVAICPPQSWPAWKREAALSGEVRPTGKPDLDNFIKAAKDALNGIVWRDDAQVTEIQAVKLYADSPGVTVKVRPQSAAPSSITRRGDLRRDAG